MWLANVFARFCSGWFLALVAKLWPSWIVTVISWHRSLWIVHVRVGLCTLGIINVTETIFSLRLGIFGSRLGSNGIVPVIAG